MSMVNNFGINAQAMAVLAFLERYDGLECSWDRESGRYNANVQVAPWYNGRERGIVVYLHAMNSPAQINIAIFEHRNSDKICAALWEDSNCTLNPPTLNDMPEEVYNDGNWTESWGYGEVADVAGWVYDQLDDFWKRTERSLAEAKA